MNFRYVRIQGRQEAYMTKYPRGIFAMCWRMIYDGVMSGEDEAFFRAANDWFIENLPIPEPCASGEMPVVTFFKTDTTAHMLKKLEPIMELLERYGNPYDVVYTNYVPGIVYEGEYQVVAEVSALRNE